MDNFNCQADALANVPKTAFQSIPAQYFLDSPEKLGIIIENAKAKLGDDLFILAHHYQKDEIVKYSDATGDSLQLSQLAAKSDAKYIVFCGVHFMAETADILTDDNQAVILPDLSAGCQMADMVTFDQLTSAWSILEGQGFDLLPITYVNSSAAVKAFIGEKGGMTCTSSNAHAILTKAFEQGKTVLFVPDQHLGRNTAFDLGVGLDEMAVWNPDSESLQQGVPTSAPPKIILWDGFCSVHQQFELKHVEAIRKNSPQTQIIVHPECSFEVVQASDYSGSTARLIDKVKQANPGDSFAIGTDNNLVARLKQDYPQIDIQFLNPVSCACLTMNRIRLPHLAWILGELAGNSEQIGHPSQQTDYSSEQIGYSPRVNNRIIVDPEIAKLAKLAIDRMM